ncbi:hypothetical protein GGR57DRAFT_449359 [Xylariaceae sp. FL1272]|nr:hypothetical protein GGR57DRAFT_449359 [Xylariaceae sp. FL1272]
MAQVTPPLEQSIAESIVPPGLSSRRRQWREQYSVRCDLGHVHLSNMPAAGLVLVRLQNQRLEIFLDQRSAIVPNPGTWALVGGFANDISEDRVRVALREAREEYNILEGDIKRLGYQWTKDHGQDITYTYVVAEPTDPNKELRPTSGESVGGQWFAENAMPTALHPMLAQDMPTIWGILNCEFNGTTHRAQAVTTERATQTTPRIETPAPAAPGRNEAECMIM